MCKPIETDNQKRHSNPHRHNQQRTHENRQHEHTQSDTKQTNTGQAYEILLPICLTHITFSNDLRDPGRPNIPSQTRDR